MDKLKELLDKAKGYRTYAAAVALLVMAAVAFKRGNYDRAGELLAAALAAAGLRAALPAPPAPTPDVPPPVEPNVLGSNVGRAPGTPTLHQWSDN